MREDPTRMVTVCAECRCATCWHGIFYCSKAKSAGVTRVARGALLEENREHPSYFTDAALDEIGDTVEP